MSIINAIFLGIIQGLTEFFPVSSSGHLALLSSVFNFSDTIGEHLMFNALVHIGSLTALLIVFWNDIVKMSRELGAQFNVGPLAGKPQQYYVYLRQFVMLLTATIPLFLILLFRSKLNVLSQSSVFVSIMLVLNGCILFVADKMTKGNKNERNITYFDSLIIGLCQCTAAIPGISRVGVAAAAGIANGVSPQYSLKFAFLISIPAMLFSNLLNIIDAFKAGFEFAAVPAYLIGTVCAILAGMLSLVIMKRVFEKGKFGYFSYYCWLIGALGMILTVIF